ncbi:preprotein translocase subunit SecE [Sphingomonas ginkgonis]|uniref:Protein translocase subunit SecE n=1 Tax=Sphingomonas ginkgonis TaxID=2315330 RepID=A0A3R9Z5J4_9SPHN|nr:preprotein translocase subunit SecE [Sphingomonas ginkgonis]RST30270.1 preprotein translocase subunit SecE [Sphingomonas ginkgonis]
MADKISPGEFIRQVRLETSKVVWPSRRETFASTIMVLIMAAILAIFFFTVDGAFNAIVKFLLARLSG